MSEHEISTSSKKCLPTSVKHSIYKVRVMWRKCSKSFHKIYIIEVFLMKQCEFCLGKEWWIVLCSLDISHKYCSMLLTWQVSRPHPSDHPLLILFLVGGVTISEVRVIKDLVSTYKPGCQVSNVESHHCLW